MNINVTLFGQMITFSIFVWFTLKYVWPPITAALEEREANITKGIKDTEKAKKSLNDAKEEAKSIVKEARVLAKEILSDAKQNANNIISEAKDSALAKHDNIVALANKEIAAQTEKSRDQLIKEVVNLAVLGSEKILEQEINGKKSAAIVDKILQEGSST